MTTLQEIRTLVRTTLDVDSEELPDALVDTWCREVSRRVSRKIVRAPWLESSWSVPTVASQDAYPLEDMSASVATQVGRISAVRADGRRLDLTASDEADDIFGYQAEGTPTHYLVRESELVLFPTPSSVETLEIRGYRKAMDWVAGDNDYEPDMPSDFEDVVLNWVLGRAYMQQEDPDMGVMYMDLADEQLRGLAANEATMPSAQPLVIGGGQRRRVPRDRALWSWEA